MTPTEDEILTCYCSNKHYYTLLLKEHYREAEEHDYPTALYREQEQEMIKICNLQNKFIKELEDKEGK